MKSKVQCDQCNKFFKRRGLSLHKRHCSGNSPGPSTNGLETSGQGVMTPTVGGVMNPTATADGVMTMHLDTAMALKRTSLMTQLNSCMDHQENRIRYYKGKAKHHKSMLEKIQIDNQKLRSNLRETHTLLAKANRALKIISQQSLHEKVTAPQECYICKDHKSLSVVLPCFHQACFDCLITWESNQLQMTDADFSCPQCRRIISGIQCTDTGELTTF